MTDAVVTAPAEAASEPVATPPNPISVDNTNHEAEQQQPEKAEKPTKAEDKPVERKSTREALKEAARKMDEAEKAETDKAKPAETKKEPPKVAKPGEREAQTEDKAKEERQRGEHGHFSAKEGQDDQQKPSDQTKPKFDAPSRWDDAAKRDWETTPDTVKGATSRTIRELETGIQEHQKRWEPIKEYDDMAKQYGTDLPSALKRYVAMDKLLSENLTAGLESIIRDKTGGQFGLREVVAHVMGQKPDQTQSQSDATTHQLRTKLDQIEQTLGAVVQNTRQQTAQSIDQQVTAFAADKPDFEALSPKIAEHIGKGMDLDAAYQQAKQDAEDLAASLGFVKPSQAPAQTRSEPNTAVPQTDKGQKSITGAPSAGTTPPKAKPGSTSIRDSLKRALQQAS